MNLESEPVVLEIPSPCVGTCRIREADQRCEGCERTIDEITRWAEMDSEEKVSVLDALATRRRRSGRPAGRVRSSVSSAKRSGSEASSSRVNS